LYTLPFVQSSSALIVGDAVLSQVLYEGQGIQK
jgi:hypothetical protein